NAPFDLLQPAGRPNYPYTIRDVLTDRRRPRAWRALFLENEYLRCSVLPDLGGHLYSCTDKVNGQEMFYANGSIKVSNIAYRGSWAAFGVEFNFPVSHNWMTTSPVDFAWREDPDGSASVWVGNVDRPYGMQWTVRLTLRPGAAMLEQFTTLYNRSDVRRRFYWWTNAGVRAFDDTQILYPMKFTASHGFTDVDTWPVDARGTDNSVLRNHVYGPVSRFAHASREGFMGIWHPRTNAGVAHYAPPEELPAKKIWSWGVDADALDWRRQLSDDSSAYVEIQAGLFRDQETYGFLQPQDQVSFREYWMPLRALGGLTRMNPHGALHLQRIALGRDSVELRARVQVARSLPGARATLAAGGAVGVARAGLSPGGLVQLSVRAASTAPAAEFTLVDGAGTVLMRHVEGVYDFLPDSLVTRGAQPKVAWPAEGDRREGDWLTYGEDREVNGDMLGALGAYRAGLGVNPRDLALLRATARLEVTLGFHAMGEERASRVLALQPADHEIAYYRGLARLSLGDTARARVDLELARQYGPVRNAAILALQRCGAPRDAEATAPLAELATAAAPAQAPRLREARLLARWRLARLGRDDEAGLRVLADSVLAATPSSPLARWLHRNVAGGDAALDVHLAGDPERILEIADALLDARADAEAVALLATRWPDDARVVREAGIPHPDRHPMVWLYRAFAEQRAGRDPAPSLDTAAALPLAYVFPNRAREREVLEWALRLRPRDSSIRYLLGMLAMQRGEVERAVALWGHVVNARPTGIPGLYRNLGYAALLAGNTSLAADVFAKGTVAEPTNAAVWVGNDSLLQLTGRPVAERAAQLDRYPDRAGMPTALVYRYARLLAAAGRFDDAEALFADRFFSRVEGGINPRGEWIGVRLARAEALVAAGRCGEARAVVRALGRPVARRPFTNDGMQEQLARPRTARRVGDVQARCGGR
ncbi:MAG TPA: DUF5107 domain-containing protein, partial [Gemmatimonadaceae bacterium]|nr:DUF5107 domain-containing protein [Gemmatimonadaceae bacterium]